MKKQILLSLCLLAAVNAPVFGMFRSWSPVKRVVAGFLFAGVNGACGYTVGHKIGEHRVVKKIENHAKFVNQVIDDRRKAYYSVPRDFKEDEKYKSDIFSLQAVYSAVRFLRDTALEKFDVIQQQEEPALTWQEVAAKFKRS